MQRRGFLSALAGLIVAPFVATKTQSLQWKSRWWSAPIQPQRIQFSRLYDPDNFGQTLTVTDDPAVYFLHKEYGIMQVGPSAEVDRLIEHDRIALKRLSENIF